MVGLGAVAGVGFTVSLFITELAFTRARLAEEAKVGILVASVIAAVLGFLILRSGSERPIETPPRPIGPGHDA
jgi:NhaA family Na+:H+ antiporter